MENLKGKVAIVTGASSGIGRATAERLGKDGAKIVVVYAHDEKAAHEVVDRIAKAGSEAFAVRANIGKGSDVKNIFDTCEQKFGRADILCNIAGVAVMSPIAEFKEEDFDRVYNTNVKGLLFSLKEAATRLKDGGRIVNTASSTTVFVFPGTAVYASSKSAIKTITEAAALEFGGRGITVNTILPGMTETRMTKGLTEEQKKMATSVTPSHHLGKPEDIADVISFLVSEDARWVSGQHILANGGGKA